MQDITPKETFFVLLKPGFDDKEEEVVEFIKQNGFPDVSSRDRFVMTLPEACFLYAEHSHTPFYHDGLTQYMTSGPCRILLIGTEMNIERSLYEFRQLMGAVESYRGPEETIRGRFGISTRMNVLHCSDSWGSYQREFEHVIKPHLTLTPPSSPTPVTQGNTESNSENE